MTAALSRADRRRMQRAFDANEPTIAADRRFFERRPHRTYRIRRMSRAEMAQIEVSCGGLVRPLSGCGAFTVVKQIASGVRLRIFVAGPADEDGSNAGDALGTFLWNRYVEMHPGVAEREAAFHEALYGPGGPLADEVRR